VPPDQYAAAARPTGLGTRLGIATLVLLVSVQFIVIIDTSIVNVTLPSIQRALHFSQQNLQWVLSGYVLTFGGLLLLGGRLGDLLGRRRMLVTGVLVFAAASMACGLANSQDLLIAARMVQGAGGALMAPAALSTIATTFPGGKDRNTAMGVYGAVSGIAGAAGVLHYSPIKTGVGFVPITACFAIAGGISSQLIARVGTRVLTVVGALTGGAGVYYLSRVPVGGSYVADVLPGMIIMALGMGIVFVTATAGANEGVPPAQAGLAAGLLNASQQLGSALGLAILSAIATSRTQGLLAAHAPAPHR